MRFRIRAMKRSRSGHSLTLDPVVHAEEQQAKRRWKRRASVSSAWIAGSSPGNDERERTKEIRRRNADRRNEYSAVANGHGRACKRQAHSYRRSTAVLVPRSLSSQGDSAPGFLFLGLGGQFGWPSSGRYPPLPVPVQRTQSRPGHSAEGLMPECRPGAGCKAARGHRTRPREPGLPPGRDRIISCNLIGDNCQRYSDLTISSLPDVIRQPMRTYSVHGSSGWTTGIGERSDAVLRTV